MKRDFESVTKIDNEAYEIIKRILIGTAIQSAMEIKERLNKPYSDVMGTLHATEEEAREANECIAENNL